jgi:hypothetical protein
MTQLRTDNPWEIESNSGDKLSDAFVFFGTTGDLAYKKIFLARHNMVRRGTLKCPATGMPRQDGLSTNCASVAVGRRSLHHGATFATQSKAPSQKLRRCPLDSGNGETVLVQTKTFRGQEGDVWKPSSRI